MYKELLSNNRGVLNEIVSRTEQQKCFFLRIVFPGQTKRGMLTIFFFPKTI